MADFRVDHEIVTKFLLNTCRLRKWLNHDGLQALNDCAELATGLFGNDETEYIAETTGSAAEFYIEPMLSCVGDVDILYHCSDELAIPRHKSLVLWLGLSQPTWRRCTRTNVANINVVYVCLRTTYALWLV